MKLIFLFACLFYTNNIFAETVNPSDNYGFYEDGSPANFNPPERISLIIKRDGKQVFSKSFDNLSVGPMSGLADADAMIKAALSEGASVDIGNGSKADLESARKRIETKKLSELSPFAKAYITNLKAALYNAQNILEDKTIRLQDCRTSAKSSSQKSGLR